MSIFFNQPQMQAQLSKESDIEEDDDYVLARFNDRFNDLRRFDKYSDCSFKIENRIINCHKLILTACSPVFEAMFYGPLGKGCPDFNVTHSNNKLLSF